LQGISPPPASAATCAFNPVDTYADFTPQQTAIGAKAYWVLRTLFAWDWADGGHANTALWVGTDNKDAGNTWVEAGVTHGYQHLNVYTFYSANQTVGGSYSAARFTMTPFTGTPAYFRGYQTSSTVYRTEVTFNGHAESIAWGGHSANTVNYSVGLEATCLNNQINRTYTSTNSFLKKSDGNWSDPIDGSLVVQAGAIGWCSKPISFRYYLNSSIADACS
jgi:hypothetical protein